MPASPKDGKTMLALDAFRRFAGRDLEAARIWLGPRVPQDS